MNRDPSAPFRPIGDAVRARRRGLRLTQAELADLAQCSERTVRDLEAGSGSPRVGTVMRVLAALGLGLQVVNSSGEVSVAEDV